HRRAPAAADCTRRRRQASARDVATGRGYQGRGPVTRCWRPRTTVHDPRRAGLPTVPVTVFVVASVVSGIVTGAYQYRRIWTPLQRQYLWASLRSGVAFTPAGTYDLLQLVDKGPRRLAVDDDVVPMTLGTADPVFVLTETAQQAGRTQLAWQSGTYSHAAIHR